MGQDSGTPLKSAKQHAVIGFTTDRQGDYYTVKARCSCGVWRQATSYSAYPGLAGAILLAMQGFRCTGAPLGTFRATRPFPADPQSAEAAARELDHGSARLRSQAAALRAQAEALLERAQEYEDCRNQIRRALEPEAA